MQKSKFMAVLKVSVIVVSLSGSSFVSNAKEITPEEEAKMKEVQDEREILWLARVLQSESNRREDQILVACVVRNRVENGYWGSTYEAVATSPWQFSGLTNPKDPRYAYNISRTFESTGAHWESAVTIARAIYHSEDPLCPLPKTTLHFYSPHIIAAPAWAKADKVVHSVKDKSGRTIFAFVDGVMGN